MPTPYDQFNKYLTKAQKNKLVQAQARFSNQNADERVEVQQQNQGNLTQYRNFLANRGLSSARGTMVSGEEARFRAQQAQFTGAFNNQLKAQEDAATTNLAANFAAQTKAARARAAQQAELARINDSIRTSNINYNNFVDDMNHMWEQEARMQPDKRDARNYLGITKDVGGKTYTDTTGKTHAIGTPYNENAARMNGEFARLTDAQKEQAYISTLSPDQKKQYATERLQNLLSGMNQGIKAFNNAQADYFDRVGYDANAAMRDAGVILQESAKLKASLADIEAERKAIEQAGLGSITMEDQERWQNLRNQEEQLKKQISGNDDKLETIFTTDNVYKAAFDDMMESASAGSSRLSRYANVSDEDLDMMISDAENAITDYYRNVQYDPLSGTGIAAPAAEYNKLNELKNVKAYRQQQQIYAKQEEANAAGANNSVQHKYTGKPEDYDFSNKTSSKYYTAINDNEVLSFMVGEAAKAKAKVEGQAEFNASTEPLTETEFNAYSHRNDDAMYYSEYASFMSEAEKNTFNYIYNNEGGAKADEYFESIFASLAQKGADRVSIEARKFVAENGALGASLASIPMNFVGAAMGAAENVRNAIHGREVNKYTAYKNNFAQSIRDTVSNDYSGAGKFLYGTFMSMGDSAVAALMGGAGGAMLGLSAYNSALADGLDRGLDAKHAQATAVMAGICEMFFEKYSLEGIKGLAAHEASSWKEILFNIAKQQFTEGSEEVATDIGNALADYLINGSASEFSQNVRAYMDDGLSESEARKRAAGEFGVNLVMSYVGGALSGGIMGGGASLAGYAFRGGKQAAAYGKAVRNDKATYDRIASHEFKNEETAKFVEEQGGIENLSDAELGRVAGEAMMEENAEAAVKAVNESAGGLEALKQFDFQDKQAQELAKKESLTDNEVAYLFATQQQERLSDVASKLAATGNNSNAVYSQFEKIVTGQKIDREGAEAIAASGEGAAIFTEMFGGDGSVDSILETGNIQAVKNEKQFGKANFIGDTALDRGASMAARSMFRNAADVVADSKTQTFETKRGSVSMEMKNRDTRYLSNSEKAAVRISTAVANAFGVNIRLIDTFVGEGNYKNVAETPRGQFDANSNTITIALDSDQAVSYVIGHELTHYLKTAAGKAYENYKNVVREQINATDFDNSSLDEKFANELNAIKAEMPGKTNWDVMLEYENRRHKGENLDEEGLADEVLAEVGSTMLEDSDVQEAIAKKQGLAEKISNFLNKLVDSLNEILDISDKKKTSAESELVEGEFKRVKAIAKAYVKLVEEANTNERIQKQNEQIDDTFKNGGIVEAPNGDPIAYSDGNGHYNLSVRYYNEAFKGGKNGRQILEQYLKKQDMSEEDRADFMKQMDDIYDICERFANQYAQFGAWSYAEIVRGENDKPVFSVVTPNAEYKMNLDFSLVCKKRRTFNSILNRLCKTGVINNVNVGSGAIVAINNVIKKNNFETACSLCYIEGKRYRQGDVADTFVKLWNDLVKSIVPEGSKIAVDSFNFGSNETTVNTNTGLDTLGNNGVNLDTLKKTIAEYGKGTVEAKVAKYLLENPGKRKLLQRSDFMSTAGFDSVKTREPQILKFYNSKKGTGGPKATFSDVQYMNEILSSKTFNKKAAYKVGGVRIQSFSDFVASMVFDYVQMFGDLAAKNLPAHAYTKEESFVKLFGLTGAKINMSLIPKVVDNGIAPGLDFSGNYVWADESFDFETAKQIQADPAYGKNCGTIAVGVSDMHIRALLDDPAIRMVIPYHKSGINPIVAHLISIDKFTNYEDSQNTKHADGKSLSKEEMKKHFNFNQWLQDNAATATPKAAADAYLHWCDQNGYTPKFSQFRDNANYYKLITDFNLVDESGNFCGQGGVTMTFPDANSAFGDVASIIGTALDAEKKTADSLDARIDSISDEITELLQTENYEHVAHSDVQYSIRSTDLSADMVSEIDDSAVTALNVNQAGRLMYATKIADGEKIEETRESLIKYVGNDGKMHELKVGDRVGIVATGRKGGGNLIAYATVSAINKYNNADEFHADDAQARHLVPKNSKYDIKEGGVKYGYVFENLTKLDTPIPTVFNGPAGTRKLDIIPAYKLLLNANEDERYKVLKNAFVNAAIDNSNNIEGNAKSILNDIESVNKYAKSQIEKCVKKLAQELGILNVPFNSIHTDITFSLSGNRNGLGESMHKQINYGGNYHDFAKALINIRNVIEGAALVYASSNDIYKGTSREDQNFESVFSLVGAFEDDNRIVPVKLEIKKQKTGTEGRLYVVVSLAEIEKTSVTVRGTIKDRTTQTVTGSSYMLQDIVANVNTKDGRFLKYIPDQMLSKEQIESKQSVIDFDNVRLDSMRNVKQNSVRDNLSSIPDQFEKVWSEKSDEDKAAIIRAMKNKALLQLNSPERVFDLVAGKNDTIRQLLYDVLEKPFNEAGGNFAHGVKRQYKEFNDGLKACFGGRMPTLKESAMIQRFGEGSYQHECKVTALPGRHSDGRYLNGSWDVTVIESDGTERKYHFTDRELTKAFQDDADKVRDIAMKTYNGAVNNGIDPEKAQFSSVDVHHAPYTKEMLMDENPEHYEKIIAAERLHREIYDNYVDSINAMLNDIYPFVLEKDIKKESELTDIIDDIEEKSNVTVQVYQWYQKQLQMLINELNHLEKEFPEDVVETRKQATKLKQDYEAANDKLIKLRQQYYDLMQQKTDLINELNYMERYNSTGNTANIKQMISDANNSIRKLESEIKTREVAVNNIAWLAERAEYRHKHVRGNNTQAKAQIESDIRRMTNIINNTNNKLIQIQAKKAEAIATRERFREERANGSTVRNKRLLKRDDYFHHFNQMTEGAIGSIKQLFATNNEISPALAGISENTKPNTKWTDFLQRRLGGKYTEDAVNGMYQYIIGAETILAYDPVIKRIRDVRRAMTDTATEIENSNNPEGNQNANNFLVWLDQWGNSIAGKSHKWDRAFAEGIGTRKVMQILGALNGIVKKSKLLFNFRSALVQVSNLTNALGYMGVDDWKNGMLNYANSFKNEDLRTIIGQSNFLSQRTLDTHMELKEETVLGALKDKPMAFAEWMLSAGDNFSSQLTWWAAYNQYARLKEQGEKEGKDLLREKGYRQYESAVDYADDITRRTHGGRGVGEVPLVLQSKIVNTFAPFQVEVLNTYENLMQQIGKKNALGIVGMEMGIFAINMVTRALFGDGVLGFDFIHALIAIIKNAIAPEDEDADAIDRIEYGMQQLTGELISGVPFAAQLASTLIPDEDARKWLFGEDQDPTRYGTGTLGLSSISDLIKLVPDSVTVIKNAAQGNANRDMIEYQLTKALDATIGNYMTGGTQLMRTAKGVSTWAKGYSANKNGRIQYTVDQDAGELLQMVLFGKWAVPEGREYLGNLDPIADIATEKNDFRLLSDSQTDKYKGWVKAGGDGKLFFKITKQFSQLTAKDENGETVSGLKKERAAKLLDSYKLTDEQRQFMWESVFNYH